MMNIILLSVKQIVLKTMTMITIMSKKVILISED